MSNQQIGRLGEDLATKHVTSLGWRIVARNWRCRAGEVDVIALDGPTLVFCEVKCRTGLGYGDPLEAITGHKMAKLRQLAHAWLAEHPHGGGPVRFDALGVLLQRGQRPTITHLRGVGG